MIENIKKCKFKYEFRDYQKRVLNEARKHLTDKKLNIVAAPGAGKTILALSLMLEIGEPSLIVAPTVLLRQQWLDRLKNDFYGFNNIENLISEDIYNPNLITITTYQSLYSIYKGKSEKSKNFDIVKALNELKIKTIVLDEAHHLKLSWLDATQNIIDKIDGTITISLTATPPYDIDRVLWNKYIGLCGEIDAEILVPELIKTKDLAPHQDFIFFNYPSDYQIDEINQYSNQANEFFLTYSKSKELITAISMHEGIINLESKLDYFIENFEYYDAMISFLNFNNIKIPDTKYFHYEYKKSEFDIIKLQTLLTYCIYNDRKSYKGFEKIIKEITRELNKIGAIYEKSVNLIYTNDIKNSITQNVGKIDSVKTILELEKKNLGNKLKSVVITEKIYKELLEEVDDYDTKYVGVIPLFRYLLKNTQLKYIVLTGEIIIIPTEYKDILLDISKDYGVFEDSIEIDELSFNFDYSKVKINGNAEKNRVLVITKLFEITNTEVLIGSNALIGEGWDAPFINTLIMATPISAYVSANQIRGRAIRKDKKEPLKFSNIWHLVCIEESGNGFKYGYDYENIIKRFDAFEGIDITGGNISYGIRRLDLPNDGNEKIESLDELNNKFIRYASNRLVIGEAWTDALNRYKPVRKNVVSCIECISEENDKSVEEKLIKSIRIPVKKALRNSPKGTESRLYFMVKVWLAGFCALPILGSFRTLSNVIFVLMVLTGVFGLPITYCFYANSGIGKKGNKKNQLFSLFAKAIHITLVEFNIINKKSKLIVKYINDEIQFFLENSTLRENECLKNALTEFISKIDNPRYVLRICDTYFAVPTILGKKQESVECLKNNLGGTGEIIYLRSAEGKRKLFNIKLVQNKLVDNIEIIKNYIDATENKISENMINIEVMDKQLIDKECR